MKKIYFALMCMASLAILTACGGGNAGKNNSEAQEAEATEQAEQAEQTELAKTDVSGLTLGDANNDNYVELVKALCGVDLTPSDGMTLEKAYGSPGNANIKFKGVKGIEERDLQKMYFERCQAVADDGTIYSTVSDGANGIQKGEPIKSFDDFKGVNWVYEYKGNIVNCSVSKYGGMKSLDSFDVVFRCN